MTARETRETGMHLVLAELQRREVFDREAARDERGIDLLTSTGHRLQVKSKRGKGRWLLGQEGEEAERITAWVNRSPSSATPARRVLIGIHGSLSDMHNRDNREKSRTRSTAPVAMIANTTYLHRSLIEGDTWPDVETWERIAAVSGWAGAFVRSSAK